MNLLPLIPIAYGILSLVGGLMGYTQAKSSISLISGGVTGLLLILFRFFDALTIVGKMGRDRDYCLACNHLYCALI